MSQPKTHPISSHSNNNSSSINNSDNNIHHFATQSQSLQLSSIDLSMNTMSDEGERTCPLCMEEMDLTDQQLKPCKCGYEICVWCWHHIMEIAEKDGSEGRCPACRTPYDKERIVGMTVNIERSAELNSEKKLKSQKAKSKASEGRKHLSTVRVIQRNLVYIVGIPANLADEETLQCKEFFGQYGKILKVSISRTTGATQHSSGNSCYNVYITYSKNEEAIRCIQVVNGFVLDGKPLRACFGTTKYCHAWLRNMPCGNPDCLYLHDAGTQEDTYSKDDAISACASKLQQSPVSPSNSVHQRSGSVLPSPLDNFYGNNNGNLSKAVVKPQIPNPSVHCKNSVINGETGKSSVLPAAASWGSRVTTSNRSTIINGSIINGHDKQKSGLSSPPFPEVQISSHVNDASQNIVRMSASGSQLPLSRDSTNQLPLSNGGASYSTYQMQKLRKKECQPILKGTDAGSLEPISIVKNGLNDSLNSSSKRDMTRGIIPLPPSLGSKGFVHQVSDPKLDVEATRHSKADENTKCSFIGPQPMGGSTCSASECLNLERKNMISCFPPDASVRKLDQPAASLKLGTPTIGPMVEVASTGSVLISDEKLDVSTREQDNVSCPLSSNHGEVIEIQNRDYWCLNPISPDKGTDEASTVPEEPALDRGESSIITDILSLDIGLDDLSASSDLAKLFIGDNGRNAECSKLFNPSKSIGNNESRFSFARMGCSEEQSELGFASQQAGTSATYNNEEISSRHRFSNNASFHIPVNSQILDFHHQPAASEMSDLLSRLEVPSHQRSPIRRKAPPIPPPGFYPQHSIDQDHYFTHPSPGSSAQYQFHGNSSGLIASPQIIGYNSYTDVEFIDPAIMAVSGGKLPLSVTHMISPNYSSNLIGFSETDQRLQLLKSRSSNMNHNSMMRVDQSKYNILQDMALQEVMRNPNGSWGSFNAAGLSAIESGLLSRRGQSSLAEITNNGRVGYLDSQYGFLRPFPSIEDTKFHASNSGRFFNSAYDM